MAIFPFIDVLSVTLGIGATGTLTLSVPSGEIRTIHSIRYQASAAFGITGLRDSRGRTYSDAASGNVMPSEIFADVDNQMNGILVFPVPLILQGNIDFNIDLVEEGGAGATISMFLITEREDGS